MVLPYIDQWPQAMGMMALPQNATESWGNLADLMDEIWFLAGDKSADVSFIAVKCLEIKEQLYLKLEVRCFA